MYRDIVSLSSANLVSSRAEIASFVSKVVLTCSGQKSEAAQAERRPKPSRCLAPIIPGMPMYGEGIIEWLNQAPTLGRRVFIIDPQLLNLCPLTAGCYTPGLDALEDLI